LLVSPPQSISVQASKDSSITVPVRISTRSTRLRLVCGISGAQLIVPAKSSKYEIESFMSLRKNWLLKTFSYYDRLISKCGRYESDALYYQGEKYKFATLKDRQNSVIVSTSMKLISFHLLDLHDTKTAITKWYKSETEQLVNSRVPEIAAKYGLSYNKISVKNLRSRWGSCSKKKNLNFSLLLSAAPPEVSAYVIIHELMHLVRLDHSKKFWELVESADPDYKKHRAWLVDYAPVIRVG